MECNIQNSMVHVYIDPTLEKERSPPLEGSGAPLLHARDAFLATRPLGQTAAPLPGWPPGRPAARLAARAPGWRCRHGVRQGRHGDRHRRHGD